ISFGNELTFFVASFLVSLTCTDIIIHQLLTSLSKHIVNRHHLLFSIDFIIKFISSPILSESNHRTATTKSWSLSIIIKLPPNPSALYTLFGTPAILFSRFVHHMYP